MVYLTRLGLVLSILLVANGLELKNFLFELEGKVPDCGDATMKLVDEFNNGKIYPRVSSIVSKDYFRFYKVNLQRFCPFWKDGNQCAMRYCQVESCNEDTVPAGLRVRRKQVHENENMSLKYTDSGQEFDCDETQDTDLGYLNTTLSLKSYDSKGNRYVILKCVASDHKVEVKFHMNYRNETYSRASALEDFALWQAYDDAQDLYCTLPDDDGNAQYVDLTLNPERYTGYRGKSAHRIWHVIYKENCFRPENLYEVYVRSSRLSGMCLEKRAFYRAVSGLHTSINIHLSAKYLLSDKSTNLLSGCNTGHWGPNIHELKQKFAPEHTNGEGPQWLRNLYFLYLVELRALAKASRYLEREEYYTGNEKEDAETRKAVANFLKIVRSFPSHFNESSMFSERIVGPMLKEEFRVHFRNISAIMDCVGCEKCKLWGKLQIQGLGTAFRILFSEKLDKLLANNNTALNKKMFQLERSEIVALLNAFARLSTSIYELENFRNTMR